MKPHARGCTELPEERFWFSNFLSYRIKTYFEGKLRFKEIQGLMYKNTQIRPDFLSEMKEGRFETY